MLEAYCHGPSNDPRGIGPDGFLWHLSFVLSCFFMEFAFYAQCFICRIAYIFIMHMQFLSAFICICTHLILQRVTFLEICKNTWENEVHFFHFSFSFNCLTLIYNYGEFAAGWKKGHSSHEQRELGSRAQCSGFTVKLQLMRVVWVMNGKEKITHYFKIVKSEKNQEDMKEKKFQTSVVTEDLHSLQRNPFL